MVTEPMHDDAVRKMVLGFSCGHWDELNVDPECEWSVGDTVACGQCNDLALVVALGGCPHHGPDCVADPREGQDGVSYRNLG